MTYHYFTGCAVWAYKAWVGSLYPQGSKAGDFLRLYCDRMTAAEGNTTFYSQPDANPQLGSERKKPRVPLQPVVTAPFTVVRYISHPSLGVNIPYFEEWVPRLQQWLAAGQQVYFFAHCPQEVSSPAVARQVYHRLQRAGADLPDLLWDRVERQRAEECASSAQLSLF